MEVKNYIVHITNNISPWCIVAIVIFSTVATNYVLELYSTVHLRIIRASVQVAASVDKLKV